MTLRPFSHVNNIPCFRALAMVYFAEYFYVVTVKTYPLWSNLVAASGRDLQTILQYLYLLTHWLFYHRWDGYSQTSSQLNYISKIKHTLRAQRSNASEVGTPESLVNASHQGIALAIPALNHFQLWMSKKMRTKREWRARGHGGRV